MPKRLDDLKRKLRARTGPDGEANPGYEENVRALQAEIARLSA